MNCGLCAKELEIIQEILSRYEAIQSAVLFGSSVTGNFKTASDIDIALKGAITIKLIAKIKAEFEDSTLPFFVDIVDYAKADNALKNEIDTQGVMLYPHFKVTTNAWQRVKLGEVAEIMSGGTPKTSVPEYWGGDIAWLTPKDLTGYTSIYISKGERFITQEGLKNSSATIMPKGTILLSSRAPIGYVAIAQNDICTNQGFKSLICKKEKANNLFIYYWIKKNTQYLQSLGTGTTFGELSKNVVQNIEISLPPLETQHKIAEILSGFDDKIDLLHRQNKTLESLALTLFRHTFIDNPNRNEWEIGKLGDYVKIELGGTPNTAKSEYWGGDIAWINSGEINKFRIIKPTKTITKLGFEKSNTKLLPKGSVVIAITGATLGQVSLLEIDSCANQSVVGVIPNDDFSSEFLYLWIKFNIDKIILNQTGGAQQHINKNDIANYPIIKPSKEFLANINLKIYFNKISHNMKEIQNLESLRDIMLPKLLSGEMEIKGD